MGVAFWGRTLFCLLICCSGLLGATRQTFYCRAFFWPGDQSRPFRAARSFCFVGAAIGAAQCLFCCSGLLGPRVIFVCCCGFLGPRNDSVLWARPFGAAPCFLFLSQQSLGPRVNFSTVAAFLGHAMTPFVGMAFHGHAMFGLVAVSCGPHVVLFVVMAQSGHATILFC